MTNGYRAPDDEFDAEAVADDSIIEPIDTPTAKVITSLLPIIENYRGAALLAANKGLAVMVGCLSREERAALEMPLRQHMPFNVDQYFYEFMASCPPPPGESVFKLGTLADLFNRPDKIWLIDQVIGAGDIGMIYGGPGSGKTFAVIDLIFSACLGQQWAMRFDVPRPLTVVYTAGEGISGLKERFRAAAHRYNVTDHLPGFSFSDLVPQLFSAGDDAMSNFVAEWQQRQENGGPALDLLIIDTLHAATIGADENSAQDMGKVLAMAKQAARELGCAVLLVHHSNKAGTGERGSSAMRGAMDAMIEIRKISETGTKAVMSCAKLKDGKSWADQTFDLVAVEDYESVRVWWDPAMDGNQTQATGQKAADKAALLAEMTRYAGTRFTLKSLADAIAKSENYTRNLLREIENAGECKRELSEPGKPQSKRNPWAFSVESLQEVAAGLGF